MLQMSYSFIYYQYTTNFINNFLKYFMYFIYLKKINIIVKNGHRAGGSSFPKSLFTSHTRQDPKITTYVLHTKYIQSNTNNINMRIYRQSNTRLTLSLRKYISLMFSYLQPQLTLLTQHMCYTQNIYNKTQEQHSPANIYTIQHRTNPCPYENTPG